MCEMEGVVTAGGIARGHPASVSGIHRGLGPALRDVLLQIQADRSEHVLPGVSLHGAFPDAALVAGPGASETPLRYSG